MAGVFAALHGHEQVVYGSDPDSGLRCIIAIGSTALGPALGGTRFLPYPSEDEALVDVLRLSRAMTFKAACAGLDLGGGKAVIIGDPTVDKTEALLRAYGRMVDSLGGRYITACDVGTTPADLALVHHETRWATGRSVEEGGSGDSAILTALGTYVGIQAACEHLWGTPDLSRRHVAVQGLGKVGSRLCTHLHEAGAKLTVADVDEAAVQQVVDRTGAATAGVQAVHAVDADVFSPNALGGVLGDDTVRELQCRVVAGAANNQLADARHGDQLHEKGVLYAPDFVVNAGGIIQVAEELSTAGFLAERARARTLATRERLRAIFELSDAEGVSPAVAAERFAQRRMRAVGGLRRLWLPRAEADAPH